MFDVWRMRQARKAAVASIAPFVETSRHRLNGIAESVWLDPYMVGFVGTLVTLAAERRSATLRTQAMGLVQADAWADITGARPDLIGEEICFLSAGPQQGLRNGLPQCRPLLRRALRQATGAAPTSARAGSPSTTRRGLVRAIR